MVQELISYNNHPCQIRICFKLDLQSSFGNSAAGNWYYMPMPSSCPSASPPAAPGHQLISTPPLGRDIRNNQFPQATEIQSQHTEESLALPASASAWAPQHKPLECSCSSTLCCEEPNWGKTCPPVKVDKASRNRCEEGEKTSGGWPKVSRKRKDVIAA